MADITDWLADLESRHLADLTFPEVVRALRALSSTYVERRDRLARRGALDTAGKRAAYALYYSPLHFLTVQQIVRVLQLQERSVRYIFDVGCGAGAAGAAWAMALRTPPRVAGVDVHPWAVAEAPRTYRLFRIDGDARRADAGRVTIPKSANAVVAGWVVNEIGEAARAHLQRELLGAVERDVQVLIVEPIATRVAPWWSDWAEAFARHGGRADEWRFRVPLPELLRRFERAAGLRHDELTARTLFA